VKRLLSTLVCLILIDKSTRADVRPVDSSEPLLTFWVVELHVTPNPAHVPRYNDLGQPIPEEVSAATLDDINNNAAGYSLKLIEKGPQISSFQSVTLGKDNKRVTVILNETDRKTLADLTRKFQGQYLCWFVPGTGMGDLFFRITAPIEDGIFEFSPLKSKTSSDIAQSLRKRFRLGEFKK
jgi:hypothetical protein